MKLPCIASIAFMKRASPFFILACVFLWPGLARADSFTFNDLTQSLSISGPASRISACLNPPAEVLCFELLAPEANATVVRTTLPGAVNISDPDGIIFSDYVSSSITIGGLTAAFTFQSFDDPLSGGPLQTCEQRGGPCQMTEDGSVQTVGTLTWSDGTVDSIQFQSDADPISGSPVPEPSSLILLSTGIAGLVATRRRKLSVSPNT